MIRTLARAVAVLLPLSWVGAAGAAPPVRVAMLPVQVHSLDQQQYLREGIEDMLATRLGRSSEVTVIVIEDPAQATSRADEARQSGREVGAHFVLYGSFTRFGEGASLDLKCVAVEGEGEADPRSIFVQAGTLGEIIPRLDELSDKVVRHVTEGPAPLPAVGAGPAVDPLAAPAAGEVDELRQRVERLEAAIYGTEPVEEEELGVAGDEPGADPEF